MSIRRYGKAVPTLLQRQDRQLHFNNPTICDGTALVRHDDESMTAVIGRPGAYDRSCYPPADYTVNLIQMPPSMLSRSFTSDHAALHRIRIAKYLLRRRRSLTRMESTARALYICQLKEHHAILLIADSVFYPSSLATAGDDHNSSLTGVYARRITIMYHSRQCWSICTCSAFYC